jgi:hypothetical protein
MNYTKIRTQAQKLIPQSSEVFERVPQGGVIYALKEVFRKVLKESLKVEDTVSNPYDEFVKFLQQFDLSPEHLINTGRISIRSLDRFLKLNEVHFNNLTNSLNVEYISSTGIKEPSRLSKKFFEALNQILNHFSDQDEWIHDGIPENILRQSETYPEFFRLIEANNLPIRPPNIQGERSYNHVNFATSYLDFYLGLRQALMNKKHNYS